MEGVSNKKTHGFKRIQERASKRRSSFGERALKPKSKPRKIKKWKNEIQKQGKGKREGEGPETRLKILVWPPLAVCVRVKGLRNGWIVGVGKGRKWRKVERRLNNGEAKSKKMIQWKFVSHCFALSKPFSLPTTCSASPSPSFWPFIHLFIFFFIQFFFTFFLFLNPIISRPPRVSHRS